MLPVHVIRVALKREAIRTGQPVSRTPVGFTPLTDMTAIGRGER